jgi:tetratricopeptide (TPR) repeat protein
MKHAIFSIFLLLTYSLSNSQNATKTIPAKNDSADYFLQKGLVEKQKGHRLESLKNFDKALIYDANNKAITAELASAYLDLRMYGQAIATYKKLESLGDQSASTYKQLLKLSFLFKQNDDVLQYADKLKKADPSEKVSYYTGKVHYDNENYGVAIKVLTQASKEEPENGDVPYLIGECYSNMSNYKSAIPYYLKAIELKPNESKWLFELGTTYSYIKDDKNAVKYILEAGNKGYKRSNDYIETLGLAYIGAGDFENGAKTLNEVLLKKASNITLLYTIAETYYYKGKLDEAIIFWDKILEYDKANANALYMIGRAYQKKGGKENDDKGSKLCEIAIGIDPSLAAYRQKKMMEGL